MISKFSRYKPRHKKLQKPLWQRKIFFVLPILLISLSVAQYVRSKEQPHQPTPTAHTQQLTTTPTNPVKNEGNVMSAVMKIVVDVAQQSLSLYEDDKIVKSYPISTSKYGTGSAAGTDKTPLGQHKIVQKIGEGAAVGTIFKARVNTGKLAKINGKNVGDLVTTRIMWLEGLEKGKNAGPGIDSYQRFIYIHGTAEENLIGRPASHGCIRMLNNDVIDLFNRVPEGIIVDIREKT